MRAVLNWLLRPLPARRFSSSQTRGKQVPQRTEGVVNQQIDILWPSTFPPSLTDLLFLFLSVLGFNPRGIQQQIASIQERSEFAQRFLQAISSKNKTGLDEVMAAYNESVGPDEQINLDNLADDAKTQILVAIRESLVEQLPLIITRLVIENSSPVGRVWSVISYLIANAQRLITLLTTIRDALAGAASAAVNAVTRAVVSGLRQSIPLILEFLVSLVPGLRGVINGIRRAFGNLRNLARNLLNRILRWLGIPVGISESVGSVRAVLGNSRPVRGTRLRRRSVDIFVQGQRMSVDELLRLWQDCTTRGQATIRRLATQLRGRRENTPEPRLRQDLRNLTRRINDMVQACGVGKVCGARVKNAAAGWPGRCARLLADAVYIHQGFPGERWRNTTAVAIVRKQNGDWECVFATNQNRSHDEVIRRARSRGYRRIQGPGHDAEQIIIRNKRSTTVLAIAPCRRPCTPASQANRPPERRLDTSCSEAIERERAHLCDPGRDRCQ